MYAKRIAERVKRIRLQKEMTQEVLAIRAGLTKGYVSLLESGKKVPAISTLYRLATALGVGLGDFFEEAKDTPEIVITRNGEGVRISSKNSFGYEYEALATGKTDKFMDPFFVSVSPGKKGNEFVHKGQEFMYVIEGALKLTYKGKEHILNPGDCAYFESGSGHKLETYDEKPVRILSINTDGLGSFSSVKE